MQKLKVKASPGGKCPMEGASRKYITDDSPVEVPSTSYYRRLIRDGSLVRVADNAPKAPPPAEEKAAQSANQKNHARRTSGQGAEKGD